MGRSRAATQPDLRRHRRLSDHPGRRPSLQRLGDKIVYRPYSLRIAQETAVEHLDEVHVVEAGGEDEVDFGRVLDDLGAPGVRRLMVEGGQSIHTHS